MKTKVNAIQCRECSDIIYSRARHDFRTCSCGNCSIDGGFDYMKISFGYNGYIFIDLSVNATEEELYNDWNYRNNRYGLIRVD